MPEVDDPVLAEWSERIHYARRRLRETQAVFGARVGVSRETISSWERGEALPRAKHRRLLVQVFTKL